MNLYIFIFLSPSIESNVEYQSAKIFVRFFFTANVAAKADTRIRINKNDDQVKIGKTNEMNDVRRARNPIVNFIIIVILCHNHYCIAVCLCVRVRRLIDSMHVQFQCKINVIRKR